MVGTINYLEEVGRICESNKGDCRRCRLGEQEKLKDTLCPRLTHPKSWDKEKIVKMAKSC